MVRSEVERGLERRVEKGGGGSEARVLPVEVLLLGTCFCFTVQISLARKSPRLGGVPWLTIRS